MVAAPQGGSLSAGPGTLSGLRQMAGTEHGPGVRRLLYRGVWKEPVTPRVSRLRLDDSELASLDALSVAAGEGGRAPARCLAPGGSSWRTAHAGRRFDAD